MAPANKAGPWVSPSTVKGPNVVKELAMGIVIAIGVGSLWKMQQWKMQKRTREFYEMLDKGQIGVVVEDE